MTQRVTQQKTERHQVLEEVQGLIGNDINSWNEFIQRDTNPEHIRQARERVEGLKSIYEDIDSLRTD